MTERKQTSLVKEFLAGCFAGFSKIYTGQPFDIVKVRLQSAQGPNKPSPLTVVSNLIKYEGGVRALWKGSLPPLIGVGATVSIQFGVNENVKKLISKANGGRPFSFRELYLSGFLAGFANCIVSIPAEHFRIRMQTQLKEAPIYKGSVDCMQKIFRNYGFKGVFRGTVPTILRDSIGYGLYFSLYATLMKKFAPGQARRDCSLNKVGLSGAITGIVFWTVVFPFDVIKTRMQTDNLDRHQYKGTVDCFKQVYRKGGPSAFFQGFAPCLLRAVPVNGIVFMMFEFLHRNVIDPAPKLLLAV